MNTGIDAARKLESVDEMGASVSLALAAVEAALVLLDRYAMATDHPAWEVVAAADDLTNAHSYLCVAMAGKKLHD